MVTVSGYDPRAVFELLLNTAQFELKLKEVCYFLWAKWIVQVCLSSAKVQCGHLSWVWVFMQEVSFSQSLSGFQMTYQPWKMCMTFFTTSAQSNQINSNQITLCKCTCTLYDAGSRNRTRDTLVGGEHSHHCAIPAPTMWKASCY